MSTNEDPPVFFPTVDAQSLAKKLHEAKSLQIKQQRQLKHLKRNVNELTVLKPPQLVIEDFRGTIVNVDVLLKEYYANSDELQELMESAGDSDPTNLVVQDPRDGFGDYHSSSPERSQQRSQQP